MDDQRKTELQNIYAICLEIASRIKSKKAISFCHNKNDITIKFFAVSDEPEVEPLLKYYSIKADSQPEEIEFIRKELRAIINNSYFCKQNDEQSKFGYVEKYTNE
jgi:hypothetical protein